MKEYGRMLKSRIIRTGYRMQDIASMISDQGELCRPSDLSKALSGKVTAKGLRVLEKAEEILTALEAEAKRERKKKKV